MIGLDTNVLVRFVMADDPEQATRARAVVQSLSPQSQGFISQVCLAEFVWVLQSRYRQPGSVISEWLDRFLDAPEFVFENEAAVAEAVETYAQGRAELADCLIERAGKTAGCIETLTFDRKAAAATGMRLL